MYRINDVVAGALLSSLLSLPVFIAPVSAGVPVPTDWMDLGSGLLGPLEAFEMDYVINGSDGFTGVAGFEVQFDYSEPTPDRSWASDVQVVVTGAGGEDFIVGGLTNLPAADADWSFQGEGSDDPGHYGDSGADVFLPWIDAPLDFGTFNVTFTNDWATDTDPNLYENTQVRFYVIPGPGALALLGMAGLAAVSRRRRAVNAAR